MSYNTYEKSEWRSQPVELYVFTRGATGVWRYTSSDAPVVYDGHTYAPIVIRRGELPQNEERNNATLEVWMAQTTDVAGPFVTGVSPSPTWLTLIRRQRAETTLIEQAVMFVGQVGTVDFGDGEAHMLCVPLQKATQRKVPRWLYQTQCNHMLYDQFCTVNPAGFTAAGTVVSINNRDVVIAAAALQPDGYYNAGFIKDGDSYFFITTHVGSTLTLLAAPLAMLPGDAVSITAGCDRTKATCIAKFANLPNFMGFPDIPDKNPYGGLI